MESPELKRSTLSVLTGSYWLLAIALAFYPGLGHAAHGRKCGASVAHQKASVRARKSRALGGIPADRIKGDQQDRKHDDPQVPCARCLSSLNQVGDRGAEQKYLQSQAQTSRNFDEGKLIDEGSQEDGAAGQGGCQAQDHREDVLAPARRLRFFAHPVVLRFPSIARGCWTSNDFIVAFQGGQACEFSRR